MKVSDGDSRELSQLLDGTNTHHLCMVIHMQSAEQSTSCDTLLYNSLLATSS